MRHANRATRALGPLCLIGFIAALTSLAILDIQKRRSDYADSLVLFDKLRSVANYKLPPTQRDISSFHSGKTPDLVEADILSVLKIFAAKHGFEITRSENLPAKKEGPFIWISQNVEIVATDQQMYSFLADVSKAEPKLLIEKLELRANAAFAIDPQTKLPLFTALTVTGVMQSDGE